MMMLKKKETFLLVDDDPTLCRMLERALTRRGYEAISATNSEEALLLLSKHSFTKAVVDLKLAQESGLMLIRELKHHQPSLDIVMLTGYSSISTAVEAIKLGALNYLCKPADTEDILAAFDPQVVRQLEIPNNPPSVDRLEWEHIQKVLQENNGNISATARSLGMHRRTLQRKLQKRPVKQ
jgi:two-component system response regulator RegA